MCIDACALGVWKLSKSEGHDDYGLVLSEKEARKYAVVKELDEAVSLKDTTTTVLQFEVRLQNGLECGGAYLKYLRPQEAPEGYFDNDPPYSIMFGPEKCECVSTNKVHFIIKHRNPKSGEYVEHHLKNPPSVPADKLSHVYTAILKPDSEVTILVDGEEKNKASFLSTKDFEPALIPAKIISDPNAVKPDDWDEGHSYKGIWKPQQIPNPDYFETQKPDFEAIAAIGIEIWTMQDGILFDNILIADDEKVAESYRITKWKPKFDAEKEKQKAEDAAGGLFSSFLRVINYFLLNLYMSYLSFFHLY